MEPGTDNNFVQPTTNTQSPSSIPPTAPQPSPLVPLFREPSRRSDPNFDRNAMMSGVVLGGQNINNDEHRRAINSDVVISNATASRKVLHPDDADHVGASKTMANQMGDIISEVARQVDTIAPPASPAFPRMSSHRQSPTGGITHGQNKEQSKNPATSATAGPQPATDEYRFKDTVAASLQLPPPFSSQQTANLPPFSHLEIRPTPGPAFTQSTSSALVSLSQTQSLPAHSYQQTSYRPSFTATRTLPSARQAFDPEISTATRPIPSPVSHSPSIQISGHPRVLIVNGQPVDYHAGVQLLLHQYSVLKDRNQYFQQELDNLRNDHTSWTQRHHGLVQREGQLSKSLEQYRINEVLREQTIRNQSRELERKREEIEVYERSINELQEHLGRSSRLHQGR